VDDLRSAGAGEPARPSLNPGPRHRCVLTLNPNAPTLASRFTEVGDRMVLLTESHHPDRVGMMLHLPGRIEVMIGEVGEPVSRLAVVSSLRTQVLTQPLTLTCNVHNQRDTPDSSWSPPPRPVPATADLAAIGVTIVIAMADHRR